MNYTKTETFPLITGGWDYLQTYKFERLKYNKIHVVWIKIAKVESFMSRELKNVDGKSWRSLCYTCSTQHVFSWTFELLSCAWTVSSPHYENQTTCVHYFERNQPVLPTGILCLHIGLNQSLVMRPNSFIYFKRTRLRTAHAAQAFVSPAFLSSTWSTL